MMKTIGLIIARRILSPIYSFIVNVLWWIVHFWKLPGAIKEKKRIKRKLGSMEEVKTLLGRFVWVKDVTDWVPWVITIIAKDIADDCDGAARLGHWALKQIGIPARRIGIYNFKTKDGHAICVSNDKTIIISNNSVDELTPNMDWKEQVFTYFDFRYNVLLEGWKVHHAIQN